MTPNYFSPSSSLPFVEEIQSQDHLHFAPISQPSSSSFHTIFTQTQDHDHGRDFQVRDQKPLQLLKNEFSATGPSDCQSLPPPPSLPVVEERDGRSEKPLIYKHDQDSGQSESGPIRWMSSKMRIMRKIINSDQVVMDKIISRKHATQNKPRSSPCSDETSKGSSSYSNSSSNMIRACADCNTTKTPLWRSGPQGPKSLCNACGIRQRKARRAMAAAAAAAATGGVMATADTLSMASKVPKEKRSDCTTQHKKRCKLADAPHPKKKLLFDDLTISLSKSLAFHQVFPQDEKEAAILLMAISYGLVNG